MDQRLHPRVKSNHAAWIEIGEMPLLATTAGNVSKDGLLLHLTHPSLMPTAVVRVIMEDPASQTLWKARAMVVHTSQSGTGLLLMKAVPSLMTSLGETTSANAGPGLSATMS